jgi:uncharacterized protein (DUF2267 family)
MKSDQPDVFETTLQKTNSWVKEVNDRLHWDNHHKAYHGLRAVLHALRDRLPLMEAVHLGSQLPMLVRGFYYEGWKPSSTPVKVKTLQQFYELVQQNFTSDRNVNPTRLTEAVMGVLAANVSPGELHKLRSIFPDHLKPLWPETTETASR